MSKRAWKLACYPLSVVLGACLLLTPSEARAQLSSPQGGYAPITDLDEPETMEEDAYTPILPADAGLGCPSSWYVHVDAVYMANEANGPLSLSQDFALGEFGNELGGRVTVGRRRDCLAGWEASYVGPIRWEVAGELRGALLSSSFVVPGGAVNISAFNQAEFHRQTSRSTLQSFELNKRCWDWDTMGGLIGFRYLQIEDRFTFFSQDPLPAADTGFFAVNTRNYMPGVQCGLDLFYNVGAAGRLSLVGKTKFGLYANFAEGDVLLINAGAVELDNDDSEFQLAFLGELGFSARYRILPCFSVQAGYEIWYLAGLAQSHGQTVSPLTPATGTDLDSDNDTWYHAATVGAELVW